MVEQNRERVRAGGQGEEGREIGRESEGGRGGERQVGGGGASAKKGAGNGGDGEKDGGGGGGGEKRGEGRVEGREAKAYSTFSRQCIVFVGQQLKKTAAQANEPCQQLNSKRPAATNPEATARTLVFAAAAQGSSSSATTAQEPRPNATRLGMEYISMNRDGSYGPC